MKRKLTLLILALCLTIALLHWLGVGFYTSGSAVLDLKAELESIYGVEYTGKAVENGTEDMVFVVEPKTWFLTNWNLRNTLGIDYKYECKVIFTTYTEGNQTIVRTVSYQGTDPMGAANITQRASLDLDSKTEITERKLPSDK